MKTNTLFTLLLAVTVAFMMGCEANSWQSKIAGSYKSIIYNGGDEYPAKTTFKTDGGKFYFICRGFFVHDQTDAANPGAPESVRESRQYLLQQADSIPAGTIRQGSSKRYPLEFTIPNEALPTHLGHACAVRWTLHATLEAPGDTLVKAQQELYVESVPPVLPPQPTGYRSDTSSPQCRLILILPQVVCAEGDTLKGEVQIVPLESFDAQEVRVLLLRIENTSEGDDHVTYVGEYDTESGQLRGERLPGGQGTTYVWLEDEADLSGFVRYQAAEPVDYAFELHVPTQWRPTVATKDGRVTWKVAVVVDRGRHSDLRAFHEVIVHTAMPGMAEALAPSARSSPLGR